MKKVTMKGRNVEEAKKAALQVLGAMEEEVKVNIINEGKSGMLGMIGGEEAEVEVVMSEGLVQDAKQTLQDILDRMQFTTIVEATENDGNVSLNIKGDDIGRIIGKEGATLKAMELIVGTMLFKSRGSWSRVSIDAGEYNKKREMALERLAGDAADEVVKTGNRKDLPHMSAKDRRIIHMFLQNNDRISTFSEGEGRDRHLVIAPKE